MVKTLEMNAAGRDRLADKPQNSIPLAANGRPKQRLTMAMEWLDGEESLQWGILDAYTPRSTEGKEGDDYSDAEYEVQQTNGLEPTVIFKILAPASSTRMLTPEQTITLFALRLAFIEKLASGIGTLSFIWATTIILGGFASSINPVDFMVITLILVTEGTRRFSRSGELEWQHLASKSSHSSLAPRTVGTPKLDRAKSHGGTNDKSGEVPALSSEPPRKQPESAIKTKYRRSLTTSWHDDPGSPVGWCKEETFRPNLCLQPKAPSTQNSVCRTMVHSETEGLEEVTDRRLYHHTSWDNDGPAHNMLSHNSTTTESSSRKFSKVTFGLGMVDTKSFKAESGELPEPVFCCGYSSILSTSGAPAVLYWVQMISVIICLVLSCWRLWHQEYCPPAVLITQAPVNLYMSLNIFYILALTKGFLFLLKRGYWDYKINSDKLIMVQVNGGMESGDENQETTRRFFYEVYKKCIEGSVFDGLSMDIVEYSLKLLQSDNSCEQLGGLKMLSKVVDRYDGFSMDALRRIGTAPGLLERLVDMLSWPSSHQDAIRQEVAALIYKGIRYRKNCFRVAAVPGSLEGIVSLLRPYESTCVAHCLDSLMESATSDGSMALRLDGLRILLAYARDPVNLLKIGETLDLVPILVSFIVVLDVHDFQKMEGTKLETFDKALRLLAMLATARNTSGIILRPVIVRLVSGIASLRDILEFGDVHPQLQWMAIEILINLTLEDDIRRAIGSTGGVIRNLVTLYTRKQDFSGVVFATEEAKRAGKAVSLRAGDALNLLAIMNKENCMLMTDLRDGEGVRTFIPALIGMLNECREQTICAAKILRSLLEYGNYSQKREIAGCIGRVMRLVMGSSSQLMHEAVVGLSSRLLDVLDEPTFNLAFENTDRTELVRKLLGNLEYNAQVSSRFPRVRRHSIELILTLVHRDPIFLKMFMKDSLLERKLLQTVDSICEVEDFVIFSGPEGLTRHSVTMENLVGRSLHELQILVPNDLIQ